MNSYLLNRALGSVPPKAFHTAHTTRLVHHLEPAPGIRFSNRRAASEYKSRDDATPLEEDGEDGTSPERVVGHSSGVNCLAIDQFEGR